MGFILSPQSQGGSAAFAKHSPVPGGGEGCSEPLPGIKTGFRGNGPSVGSLERGGFSGQAAPSRGGKKKKEIIWAVQRDTAPDVQHSWSPGQAQPRAVPEGVC